MSFMDYVLTFMPLVIVGAIAIFLIRRLGKFLLKLFGRE